MIRGNLLYIPLVSQGVKTLVFQHLPHICNCSPFTDGLTEVDYLLLEHFLLFSAWHPMLNLSGCTSIRGTRSNKDPLKDPQKSN